jgi:hypothetical protein
VEGGAKLMHPRPDALSSAERVPVLDLLALRVPLVLLHLRLRVSQVHFQLRAQALLHFQLIRHLRTFFFLITCWKNWLLKLPSFYFS